MSLNLESTLVAEEHQYADVDQSRAPFVEDLARRIEQPRTSFHMPGHRHHVAGNPSLSGLISPDLLRSDLSEMSGVDYLHGALGPMREAEDLAAAAFGADRTFFLVNGSTGGNQAAILSALGEGQKILLPRASHRSVFTSLILSHSIPVYIPPLYHPDLSLPLAVDVAEAERLVHEHPDIAAIHVTSPSYYGLTSDLPALARLADQMGIPLLVDEAHGGHFSFHPSLPISALGAGAEMAVQSTHKTLGSLTQSSMLHWRQGRIHRRRIEEVVAMLQSSSPSVLLTASLDSARQLMATQGRVLLERTIALGHAARAAVREIPGLWCYGPELVGHGGVHDYDPTKLLVGLGDLGLSGYDAARWLEKQWGIEVEISGRDHLLFSLSFADSAQDTTVLLAALAALASHHRPVDITTSRARRRSSEFDIPRMELTPREAFFASSAPRTIRSANGEICAEWIIPYPPGIPVLAPGEVIDSATIDLLEEMVSDGATIVGPEDPALHSVRVVTA
jgi:arginine decarboxylase